MRFRVRNDPDTGPAAEGTVVTYSRLSSRARRAAAERQEPVLEARQVPHPDSDLRAYDPERAAGAVDALDDLDEPRRRRRGRGGFGAIIIGAIAIAAGMVILAYAYGVATRVDAPATASTGAPANAPSGDAATVRTVLPADDAARSTPVTGVAPPATAAPPAATDQAAREPVGAPVTEGSDGVPMDGDFALPVGGDAKPAPAAPPAASATGQAAPPPTDQAATPPASEQPAIPPAAAASTPEPAKAKAASAAPAEAKPAESRPAAIKAPAAAASTDGKPADSGDDLIANIERLLQRDGTTAGGAAQPAGGSVAPSAAPMAIAPAQAQPAAVADPNAMPLLPDPNATATTQPPANLGAPNNRLIPPADIPNVTPADTATGVQ